jgi:hypothetical protein
MALIAIIKIYPEDERIDLTGRQFLVDELYKSATPLGFGAAMINPFTWYVLSVFCWENTLKLNKLVSNNSKQ